MRPAWLLAVIALAALLPAAAAQTATLELGPRAAEIPYGGNGIEVAQVRHTDESIILEVSSAGEQGALLVTLDRGVIDARMQGEDIRYIVLVDDFPSFVFAESETTETSRVLRIPVPPGESIVEIVGTEVNAGSAVDAQDQIPQDDGADISEPPAEDEGTAPEPPAAEPEPATPPELPAAEPVMEDAGVPGTAEAPVCGPGTVIGQDRVTCVLEERPALPLRDLAFGAGAGLVAALALALVLYPISRASRR